MAKLTVQTETHVRIELSQEEAEKLTAILGGVASGPEGLYSLFEDLDDAFPKATRNYKLVYGDKVPYLEREES